MDTGDRPIRGGNRVGAVRARGFVSLVVTLAAVVLTLGAVASLWRADRARAQPVAEAKPSIIGSWKASCENSEGMVIQVVSLRAGEAVGRVEAVGRASEFHYRKGEEIIRVKAGQEGSWSGQLLWRNTANVKRWQPITLRVVDGRLNGVSEAEYCYENMERVR